MKPFLLELHKWIALAVIVLVALQKNNAGPLLCPFFAWSLSLVLESPQRALLLAGALDRELMSFKVPVTYKPPSGETLKKYICALLPKELKKAKWTFLVRTLTFNDVRTHIALIPVILLGTGAGAGAGAGAGVYSTRGVPTPRSTPSSTTVY